MRVDAEQPQLGARQHGEQPLHRGRVPVGRRDREAELLVLVGRRDVLVAARVHPGGHADHHRRAASRSRGDGVGDPVDLHERVDDDPADARVERPRDLRVRLVVAVQADVRAGDPGAQRDRELAARGGVDAQALLVHPARDRDGQERLARVVDVDARADLRERRLERARGSRGRGRAGRPRRGRRPGCRARRRASRTSTPADRHGTVGRPGDPGGPGLAGDRRAHIRSGALTPSRPRPLARTWRVASFSHRRVRCTSPTTSSPNGATRRWSYHLW